MAVMNFRNQFDILLDGRANLSSVSVDVLDGTLKVGLVFQINRASSHEPVSGSEMRKGQRSLGPVLAPNSETQFFTFGPIIASVTLKAVSLQLNGMIMMWKIQEAM